MCELDDKFIIFETQLLFGLLLDFYGCSHSLKQQTDKQTNFSSEYLVLPGQETETTDSSAIGLQWCSWELDIPGWGPVTPTPYQ